jgi:hypothetical protein
MGMPADFANLAASRSWHISSPKIAQLRWKEFCHKNHKIYKKPAKKKVAKRFEIKILFNRMKPCFFIDKNRY